MQTQPISPYAGPEHATGAEESPKPKSVLGKVKDKAKKLKTKIKKPKSPGSAENNDDSSSASSSEDESGSEPQQQVAGDRAGEEREVLSTPGLPSEVLEAIPDPHVSDAPEAGTGGVEKQLGQLNLRDESDTKNLQEDVPSAPGHVSAGVTPYLASHNLGSGAASRDFPVEEGKNEEGKDLLVTSIPTDSQGAIAKDYQKSPEEKSFSDEGENAENRDTNLPKEKKSLLEQARERIFGSSKKIEGEEQLPTSESKATITERATGTATGLKDTLAAKLGYGSNKNLTGESDEHVPVNEQDPANKSVVQKIQDSAADITGAVTSKLGYGGDKPQEAGEEVTGDKKPYTQRAYDAAYGAKDAVAAKLGYGGSRPADSPTVEGDQKTYLQKVQESAVGAKDAVVSKLGYANRELPPSTEGAYSDEQNVPASTAARFHPGEEDRALSQLITEKMSTGATAVKDTLLRPFGSSKSGPPTPTTTPPPSSAAVVAEDPLHNTISTPTNDVVEGAPHAPGEEKPGIVGKVTGAVSSLLGTSASGKKRVDERTGKANEDNQAAGVGNVETQ